MAETAKIAAVFSQLDRSVVIDRANVNRRPIRVVSDNKVECGVGRGMGQIGYNVAIVAANHFCAAIGKVAAPVRGDVSGLQAGAVAGDTKRERVVICVNSTDYRVAAVFRVGAYWQVILHHLVVFEQDCLSAIHNGATGPGLQLTGLNSALRSAAAEVEWRSVNVRTGLERANGHLPIRRQISGMGALEDLVDVTRRSPKQVAV